MQSTEAIKRSTSNIMPFLLVLSIINYMIIILVYASPNNYTKVVQVNSALVIVLWAVPELRFRCWLSRSNSVSK